MASMFSSREGIKPSRRLPAKFKIVGPKNKFIWIVGGRNPCSLLKERSKQPRFGRWNSQDGIDPDKLLYAKDKNASWVWLDKKSGISPEMLHELRSKTWGWKLGEKSCWSNLTVSLLYPRPTIYGLELLKKEVNDGIVPVKEFKLRYKTWSLGKWVMQSGNFPERLLLDNARYWREEMLQIESGIFPSKEFWRWNLTH